MTTPGPKPPQAQQEAVDVVVHITAMLIELLRALDSAFAEKPGEPVTLEDEQLQYAAAFEAVGHFLMKTDPPRADHFFRMGDAFTDALAGARPRILIFKRQRSVPNATDLEAARAWVVFAVDALFALGEGTPEEAANQVLNKYPHIKNLAGAKSHRSGYTWDKTVLEWRNTLSAPSRKKNKLAAEIFVAGRNCIESFIRDGRHAYLRERALGRARNAEQIAKRRGRPPK
jgi:hypothetical protein